MNVEQRLMDAFRAADRVEPSPDLWSRVLHSIDEDREHRRRVVRATAATVVTAIALIAAGAVSIEEGRFGRFVHRPTMEVLELISLVMLLVVLGPAIRRFGRGYAADLWPTASSTPPALLRLLDVAYYLVGLGYILVTTEFEFADGLLANRLAGQLEGGAFRIGGLLLVFGALHASTLIVLPIVALVDNSTRVNKPLARWVLLVLVVVGMGTLLLLQIAVGFGLSGGG